VDAAVWLDSAGLCNFPGNCPKKRAVPASLHEKRPHPSAWIHFVPAPFFISSVSAPQNITLVVEHSITHEFALLNNIQLHNLSFDGAGVVTTALLQTRYNSQGLVDTVNSSEPRP
jgi:hypothetical protein